jgi:hypothetical protein
VNYQDWFDRFAKNGMAGGAPAFAGVTIGGGLMASSNLLPPDHAWLWQWSATVLIVTSSFVLALFIIMNFGFWMFERFQKLHDSAR